MLAGIIIAVCVLIFPFFVSFYVSVQKQEKTAKFAVAIFGIVVFKLNAKLEGYRLYIVKSFKKPYFVSMTAPFDRRKPLIKLPKISVLSVNSLIKAGVYGDIFVPFIFISAFDAVKNSVFSAINANKPYLRLNCDINVYQDSDSFAAFLCVKTAINPVDVIIYIISIISEKLYHAIGKK